MFLLITAAGAFLGVAYARLINRRLGPRDWRGWMALTPFWVAYVVVLLTADTTDLAPQAIQSFAVGSLGGTLIDSLRAVRHRGAAASTGLDEPADSSSRLERLDRSNTPKPASGIN